MNAKLVLIKADGERRDFPLEKPRVIIGRKNSCDMRVPLSSVSREHCAISVVEDELRLQDLGSSNGTYCNGSRVQEVKLSAGDRISVGPVQFTVVIDGEPTDVTAGRPAGGPSGADASDSLTDDDEMLIADMDLSLDADDDDDEDELVTLIEEDSADGPSTQPTPQPHAEPNIGSASGDLLALDDTSDQPEVSDDADDDAFFKATLGDEGGVDDAIDALGAMSDDVDEDDDEPLLLEDDDDEDTLKP